MSGTSGDQAVDALVALGLREYEAKCFVALAQLSDATAKEVSDLAGVPRSRVYDSMENLTASGLADTQPTSPIRYRAVSNESALDVLEREHRDRLDAARDSLSNLDPYDDADDGNGVGVWTVRDADSITYRGEELVAGADESVYIAGGRTELGRVTSWIETAAESGRTVNGTLPSSTRDEVTAAVDDEFLQVSFVPEPNLGTVTRLLLTDNETALVATAPSGVPAAAERELGLYAETTGLGPVVSRLVASFVTSLSGTASFAFEPGSA